MIDLHDRATKLLKAKEAAERAEARLIENKEQFIKDINSMLASDSGQNFAKAWLRHMGIYDNNDDKDGVGLFEARGARRFYLTYVRPYLTIDVKQKIEGQL